MMKTRNIRVAIGTSIAALGIAINAVRESEAAEVYMNGSSLLGYCYFTY